MIDHGERAVATLQQAIVAGDGALVLADATALYGIQRPGVWAGEVEARLLQLPRAEAQAIRRAARRVAGTRPVPGPAHPERPPLPALVVVGQTWWVRQVRGYVPILRELGPVELERAGYDCSGQTAEGAERRLSPVEVYDRHGVTGGEVRWVYDLAEPQWDPDERVLSVSAARVTHGRTAHSAAVALWLEQLTDQPETLLDWLATAHLLQRPTCAVQISGADSIGKSLLVEALAVWLGGVTPYDVAVSRFSAALVRGPLIWLDEGAVEPHPDAFRRLTGNRRHPIEEKYRSGEYLIGCPRVLVVSNERDPLQLGHLDLAPESEQAIGRRILQLRGMPAAARSQEQTAGWAERDGDLVAHLRWLAATREVTPGARFLVEGDGAAWVATAHMRSGIGADVLHAYRTWSTEEELQTLLDRLGIEPFAHAPDLVGVSPSHLARAWKTLVGESERVPSLRRLGEALRRLAGQGPDRRGRAELRGPRRYWVPAERLA